MFGLLVAGRLVQTNMQQVDPQRVIFPIENAQQINHLVVFFVRNNTFSWGIWWVYLFWLASLLFLAIFRLHHQCKAFSSFSPQNSLKRWWNWRENGLTDRSKCHSPGWNIYWTHGSHRGSSTTTSASHSRDVRPCKYHNRRYARFCNPYVQKFCKLCTQLCHIRHSCIVFWNPSPANVACNCSWKMVWNFQEEVAERSIFLEARLCLIGLQNSSVTAYQESYYSFVSLEIWRHLLGVSVRQLFRK